MAKSKKKSASQKESKGDVSGKEGQSEIGVDKQDQPDGMKSELSVDNTNEAEKEKSLKQEETLEEGNSIDTSTEEEKSVEEVVDEKLNEETNSAEAPSGDDLFSLSDDDDESDSPGENVTGKVDATLHDSKDPPKTPDMVDFPKISSNISKVSSEAPDMMDFPKMPSNPHSSTSLSSHTDYERVYRRRNTAASSRSKMTVRIDTGSDRRTPTPPIPNPTVPIPTISNDSFLQPKELTFRLVTWNVHNTTPPVIDDQHLDSLFLPQSDITVLALQEADPVSGFVSTAQTLNGWKAAVLDTLEGCSGGEEMADSNESGETTETAHYSFDPYSNYVVSSNQLIGLLIIVIARKSLMSQISDVRVKSAGTGLLGVWGNKGAVLVEMHIGREATSMQSSREEFFVPGTRVCFLNCHLSAGGNNVARRRWEIDQMFRRLELPGHAEWYSVLKDGPPEEEDKMYDYNASNELLGDADEEDEHDIHAPFSAATTIPELSPNREFEECVSAGGVTDEEQLRGGTDETKNLIFFLGDLNYRVSLDFEEAQKLVEKNDFKGLLAHDQLLKDVEAGRVLAGLKEQDIEFPPTYKYVQNTVSETDPVRVPSYTDRIFSHGWGKGCKLVQNGYHSHMEYTVSDHKPVSATFSVSLPLIDFEKRAQVVNQYLKSVGVQENLDRPAVTVSPMRLRVQLAVLTTQTVPLLIHNIGHTPAEWEISLTTGGEDGNTTTKTPSITLSNSSGHLHPGDQEVVEVTFSAAIGAPSCDSFAIIHIKDSKDIFVDAGYDIMPSCFGSDLDTLSRLPNGARNGLADNGQVVSNMPQEIWKCVDYLWCVVDKSLDSPDLSGMFTSPGDPHLEMDIREWLDTGAPFDIETLDENPLGPQSVASQLHLLLASLSQRIIPEYVYLSVPETAFVSSSSRIIPFLGGGMDNIAEVATHILEGVPNVNANVMIYICSFIRLLVDRKVMTLKVALDVFAPLLMDSPKQGGGVSKAWKKSPINAARLLQHLIESY